jgi:hypothetical protein
MTRSPVERRKPLKRSPAPQRKTQPKRTKPVRRRGRSKYARRERNYDFLSFIKRQRYCVLALSLGTWHRGPYEGDHSAKKRAAFRKGPDEVMLVLCRPCHRDRPGRRGLWAQMAPEQYEEFCDFWSGELFAAYQASLGRL